MDEPSSDYHIKENVKFSKNLIDSFFRNGLRNLYSLEQLMNMETI